MRRHAWTVLLCAGAAACSGARAGEPAEEPAGVAAPAPDTALLSAEQVRIGGLRVEPARLAPWSDAWTVPGRLTLDPSSTETLGAVAEGRVSRVLVLPGDRVARGQVLVTLHSHEMMDARGALAAAEAGLVRAENELRLATAAAERAERLHAVKAMSLADLERARAERVNAAAQREQAAAERVRALGMVSHLAGDGPLPPGVEAHEVLVRAPFAGVVVSRQAQPGQVALVGAPLLTVSRTSSLALLLQLPEPAFAAAKPGATVRFGVAAYPGREFAARVTRVAPVVDTLSRTLEVVAAVHDPEGELRPEMYVTARFEGPPAGGVVVVPADAVQAIEGDTVVITAQPRGEALHVSAMPVRVGRRSERLAEVTDGLEAGTPVVVGGAAIARAEILRRQSAGEAP